MKQGMIVKFSAQIENPKYSPYSSANPPNLQFSGTGTIVHIDLNHYRGVVIMCNTTGKFVQTTLEEIEGIVKK